MRLDVIELKEFYYGTELGQTTKELINKILDKKINTETFLDSWFWLCMPVSRKQNKDNDDKKFSFVDAKRARCCFMAQ